MVTNGCEHMSANEFNAALLEHRSIRRDVPLLHRLVARRQEKAGQRTRR